MLGFTPTFYNWIKLKIRFKLAPKPNQAEKKVQIEKARLSKRALFV
jgi:hypothetical protein